MMLQEMLNLEPIMTIQIHICKSNLFVFDNLFYIQSMKKFAKGIRINIIEHDHPLHTISQLPFAIINATHVITKPKLIKLVQSVSSQRPIRLLFFKPIFNLCQQMAAVGRTLSQQSNNPYYLLLSPLKKLEMYKYNKDYKHKIFQSTQYFNSNTEELNHQHFLYKLDTLAMYLGKIDKNALVLICVYAMLKSLKSDSQMLYQTAIKNTVLAKCEQDGQKIIDQQNRNEMVEIRMIANTIDQEKQNQKKSKQKQDKNNSNIFTNPNLQFISRLALPVVAYAIFWKLVASQRISTI